MATINAPAALESPVTRATGYSLLAHAFAYPDAPQVAALQEAAGAGREFLAETVLEPLVQLALVATPSALLPAFDRIFTHTVSPDCPSYETAYLDTEMTAQAHRMSRIAGFYRLFGVEAPTTGYRPDEISVELEFLGFLARKELYAREHLGAPRVAQARRAQRIFLEEHLGCWGPLFGRRIVDRAGGSIFYLNLGSTIEGWLLADMERLGASPVSNANSPRIPDPLPISHGPEFAGNGAVIAFDDIPVQGGKQ